MYWYYPIELNGTITPGQNHLNILITRAVLRDVMLTGRRVLDIGTMEALLPVLLEKAGADVTAFDVLDCTEKVNKVREEYDCSFKYTLEFPDEEFDIVICSGVLYHMVNPLGGLARFRSRCSKGGLFILETAAFITEEEALYYNAKGKHYGKSNYFIPTTGWLDYVLKQLGLAPLYGTFLGGDVARVALACRSRGSCLLNDGWAYNHDLLPFWPGSTASVQYSVDPLLFGVGTSSLTECLKTATPYPINKKDITLRPSSTL